MIFKSVKSIINYLSYISIICHVCMATGSNVNVNNIFFIGDEPRSSGLKKHEFQTILLFKLDWSHLEFLLRFIIEVFRGRRCRWTRTIVADIAFEVLVPSTGLEWTDQTLEPLDLPCRIVHIEKAAWWHKKMIFRAWDVEKFS